LPIDRAIIAPRVPPAPAAAIPFRAFPYIGGVASTVGFLLMLCVGQFAS